LSASDDTRSPGGPENHPGRRQRSPEAASRQPDVPSTFEPSFSPRTDLALEAREAAPPDLPGVESTTETLPGVVVTRVRITTPEAAQVLNKAMGNYVTIECPGLRDRNWEDQDRVSRIISSEVRALLPRGEYLVLVAGLGNWRATPDALGPRTVSRILVTRHLREFVPQDLRGDLAPVSAVAPGVLGTTGIQTLEILRGIVNQVQPGAVVVIDALAARSTGRLLNTVQIADSGIQPGSGVGGQRDQISRETLGVPVIAIGVPTVVHALTIANDAARTLARQLGRDLGRFEQFTPQMKERLISEALSPEVGELMVTPKEIDVNIDEITEVLADGLNVALQPRLEPEEIDAWKR